jgi:hypothetical protein
MKVNVEQVRWLSIRGCMECPFVSYRVGRHCSKSGDIIQEFHKHEFPDFCRLSENKNELHNERINDE